MNNVPSSQDVSDNPDSTDMNQDESEELVLFPASFVQGVFRVIRFMYESTGQEYELDEFGFPSKV